MESKVLSGCLIAMVLMLPFFSSGCKKSSSGTEEVEWRFGGEILPGVIALNGFDLIPFQTSFSLPELADPYVTQLGDSAVVSGTAQYHLRFRSIDDIQRGGPYKVEWNDFFYSDGTPMEGGRFGAHSWDMKPVLWSGETKEARLWDPQKDSAPPMMIWYGGHMRPRSGEKISYWPEDNYSRDVFAFVEQAPGKWFSRESSIFSERADWPRARGSFLGHRYGHQIIKTPRSLPSVFYEEVTEVRQDGSPLVTKIFMDDMVDPFQALGKPTVLISPVNPVTGKYYPSAIREDGAALVEGPLYFRFSFEGEQWEGIGFSAGSFYGKYPAVFASRKISDGLLGKPFEIDLNDDGSDFHDAGADLGQTLNLAGGPGRPSVIVGRDGVALQDQQGALQLLVHGYRKDILPDNDYTTWPNKYRLDQMFRVMFHAFLKIERGPWGTLRFQIISPKDQIPNWNRPLL